MSGNMDFERNINWNKVEKQKKTTNDSGKYFMEKEESEEKYLKSLHDTKTFDRDLFNLGVEYYTNGGKLEDVKEEYRNNKSFLNGYARGERLAMIEQIEEKYSKKSR